MMYPCLVAQPPSDFTDEPSSGPSWLKIGAIGCGVVLLLSCAVCGLGAYMGAGLFSDAVEATKASQEVGTYGLRFAEHLSHGDFDEAHALLSDGGQERMDVGALRGLVESQSGRVTGTIPVVAQIRADASDEDRGIKLRSWEVVVHFATSTEDVRAAELQAQLELTLALDAAGGPSVDAVSLREVRIAPRLTPPVQVVQRSHELIAEGQEQLAWAAAHPDLQAQTSIEQFGVFLDDVSPGFRAATLEIVDVRYASTTEAVVSTTAQYSEQNALVVFTVKYDGLMWRISGVTSMVATAEDLPAEAAPE
ncbi:MAG: hypothetical protein AAGI01_14110 [Myxococcota bacterium]